MYVFLVEPVVAQKSKSLTTAAIKHYVLFKMVLICDVSHPHVSTWSTNVLLPLSSRPKHINFTFWRRHRKVSLFAASPSRVCQSCRATRARFWRAAEPSTGVVSPAGSAVVDWLVFAQLALTRVEALTLASALLEEGFLRTVGLKSAEALRSGGLAEQFLDDSTALYSFVSASARLPSASLCPES